MVRHYVLDASLESYADAHKMAEQQRFFGVDGYLGHFSSDAEKSVYGSMAQGRPLWLGLSDRDNAGVWKVSSGPKEGQVFWRETGAGVGIYGSGSPGSGSTGSGSTDSGWGDADWEKFWGTNDFPQRPSLKSGFPVALLSGDDAEVSSSESTQGARIVHHDLLLSSGGFFAREVRVPKASSTEGGRSDADTGDTAEVAPQKEVLVRKTRASLSRQTRQSPSLLDPPVLDVTGLARVKMGAEQRLILTEARMSVTDANTLLAGNADADKNPLRISAVAGGILQRLSPSDVWEDMTLAAGQDYYAFTLADLKAGEIAFLAGNGVAKIDGGNGKKITFQIQAVDDDGNLSDSDPATSDPDPVDAEILVVASARATAGYGSFINTDGLLTPGEGTLTDWLAEATTYGGTLRLVVKLSGWQVGDALSLRGSYDTSKITLEWNESERELSLEIDANATAKDMQTALGVLWLDTSVSASDSTRRIWVFPTLSEVGDLRYLVHESTDQVRYYLYEGAARSFSDASSEAEKRSLFGKRGYLGVFTSSAEKIVYMNLKKISIHLAISDFTTEGKWVITAGPRKGLLFWDHSAKKFGPGAKGSSWTSQGDFWSSGEPNNGEDAGLGGGSVRWTSCCRARLEAV